MPSPAVRSREAPSSRYVPAVEKVSDRLERWFGGDQSRTLGGLVALFGEKSFAVVFIVLMAVPALPLPTGGITHVFEAVTMLLALSLVAFAAPPFSGRDTLPALGVVLVALGVLLEDFVLAVAGLIIGASERCS
jgi:hypothetical protein